MNQPLPILTRAAPLAPASWNPQDRSFEVVFATEAPVSRRDARGPYFEVLSIAGMEASSPALPVLDSHARGSLSSQIGSASNVRVVGGEALAAVRLSRANPIADRVAIDLDAGQTFGVSTGYIIHQAKETQRDGARYLTATRWTVVEISLVPVPADARTGIRSQFMPVKTQAATPENNQPAAVERAAAASMPTPAPTPEARVADRAAVNAEIRSIARVASLDQTWIDAQIDGGASVEAARTAAFEVMRNRTQPAGELRTQAIVGTDFNDPEARARAIGEALFTRTHPSHQPSEAARQFVGMSIPEIARDCLRTRGIATTGMATGADHRTSSAKHVGFPAVARGYGQPDDATGLRCRAGWRPPPGAADDGQGLPDEASHSVFDGADAGARERSGRVQIRRDGGGADPTPSRPSAGSSASPDRAW